jgi:signal transduction histidine kinase
MRFEPSADRAARRSAGPPNVKRRAPYTTLRLKTMLILGVTLVGLLLILYVPLRLFLLDSFTQLQEQAVRTDVGRAVRVLSDDLVTLDRIAASIAADETAAYFAADPSTWRSEQTSPELFGESQVTLFLFADPQGHVLHARSYDPSTGLERPAPPQLQSLIGSPLLRYEGNEGVSGLLSLPADTLLIATRPIVSHDVPDKIEGIVAIGRGITAVEQPRLAEVTHLDVSFHRLDRLADSSDVARALPALQADPQGQAIRPLSRERIAGYQLLSDLDGEPTLVLRVETPRSIFSQGLTGVFSFSLALLATALVFSAMTWVLLEKTVLSRLSALIEQVDTIGTDDPSARVRIAGDDELSHLAGAINGTLDALERTREERRREEERARLREESLRARRQFISTVSHELRTPLTPIGGFVDMLLMGVAGKLNSDQEAFLHTIKSNTQRMTALVDDLLEVGRLESGRVTLNRAPLDLRRTIADMVEMLRPELLRKEMELTLDIAPGLPSIDADGKRIGQVLANLLSNAIKYTYPRGKIAIQAFARTDGQIEVRVADTGVGLSAEQQPQLFTPFYRADSPLRDEVGGTGLGLHIAKSFVELHGGTIWVESEAGVGSTFAFSLPTQHELASSDIERAVGEPVA